MKKDVREIPYLNDGSEFKDSIVPLNEFINSFNNLVSDSLHLNGQIIENIVLAAGETKVIYHKLGVKPKHRLILNQEGNGVLSDIPSGWNNFSIQMKNNGAVSVTATIMLVRE